MKLVRKVCASLFLLSVAGLVACGSDDDDKGGSSAKLESCKTVCDKTVAGGCQFLGAEDCKKVCDAFAQASSACQDALKAQSDCQLSQADVCSGSGCDAQESAFNQACSK